MKKNAIKYSEFKKSVLMHLEQYKKKNMPNSKNGIYKGTTQGHVLLKEELEKNLLPLSTGIGTANYHMYAHHLNSSQMMGINFFSPLFKDESKLIELVCKQLNIPATLDRKIDKKKFEYTPDGPKRTTFDFYIKFTTGEKIYFELKYTENEFGGVKIDGKYPDRYEKEWDGFYKEQVEHSKYLKDISYEDFYDSYQINRNIAYITEVNSNNEYVCFVYPFDNEKLSAEMDRIQFPNVAKIDWEDFCNTALDISEGTVYHQHYLEFKEKYLNY